MRTMPQQRNAPQPPAEGDTNARIDLTPDGRAVLIFEMVSKGIQISHATVLPIDGLKKFHSQIAEFISKVDSPILAVPPGTKIPGLQ